MNIKHIALIVGSICLFSCTQENQVEIEKEEQLVDVNFSLQFSASQAGTKTEIPTNCLDPDDIDATQHHLNVTYRFKEGDDTDYSTVNTDISIKKENGLIYSDIVKFKPGTEVIIDQAQLHENITNKVLYSSVGKTASSKYTELVPEAFWTPTDNPALEIKLLTKQYISLFLLCATEYNPVDFGYEGFDIDLTQLVCMKYTINICGDPCDADVLMKHSVGEGALSITKYENDIKKDTYYGKVSGEGEWGELCFYDRGGLDDKYERFVVKLTINDVIHFTANWSLADMKKIQAYLDAQTPGNAYLHWILCPDSWTDVKPGYELFFYDVDDKKLTDLPTMKLDKIDCDEENSDCNCSLNYEKEDPILKKVPKSDDEDCCWLIVQTKNKKEFTWDRCPGDNLTPALWAAGNNGASEKMQILTPPVYFKPGDKVMIVLRSQKLPDEILKTFFTTIDFQDPVSLYKKDKGESGGEDDPSDYDEVHSLYTVYATYDKQTAGCARVYIELNIPDEVTVDGKTVKLNGRDFWIKTIKKIEE